MSALSGNDISSLDDIRRQLEEIDGKLKGKSTADQRGIFNEERDNLVTIIKKLIKNHIPLVGSIPLVGTAFAWIGQKLMDFFGFDPLVWFYFEEYDNFNARFADRTSSNPFIYDTLNQAGKFFEQYHDENLNVSTEGFHEEVTNANIDHIVTAIKNFCRVLTTKTGNVTISINDVTEMISSFVKTALNSSTTETNMTVFETRPIVSKEGYGWVKYTFTSDMSIEEGCCKNTKYCHILCEKKCFFFTSEAELRNALLRLEKRNGL